MFNKLLVAVDGSKSSQGAIELAKNLAKCGMAASVTLISVDQAQSLPLRVMDFMVADANKLEPLANMVVENAQASLERGGVAVDTVVVCGDPGVQILEYAKAHQYDCILMGSRGLSVAKEMVLGSVSHRVLHNAHCPVLIYRDY